MSYYAITPKTTYGSGNVLISTGMTGTSATSFTVPWNGTSATTWDTTYTNPVTITQKATIDLRGDDADITINGESLKDSIKEIKDFLRIPGKINRDKTLEEDWEELKKAADHYERLLKEYKEKQKVWDTLKDKNLAK